MNVAQLLTHFDRISEAPDAIPRLRGFILDLAVRGKLVEQEPQDQPASELLKSIKTEKTRLVQAGELGRQALKELHPDEAPFEVPVNWVWTTLGEICSKTGSGSTPRGGKSVYRDCGVPFLRSQNVYDEGLRLDDVAYIDQQTHQRMAGTVVKPGDLLLNITGGSMGRCCRVPADFIEANVSQHVAIIRVTLPGMQDFLHRLTLSPYFQSFIFDEQTGAGRGGLPKNKMDRIPVALPPLAEQHRIVAKVDELMALCDQLEAGQKERERRRDQLTAASLNRLNHRDDAGPSTFREHVRFQLRHLEQLTARPDQIPQLRQTILNLAVSGSLMPQDPSDEPACDLLERINKERLCLVERGVIKTSKAFPKALKNDYPFQIPVNWQWARLGDLTELITKGSSPKWQGVQYVSQNEGVLFVTSENVGNYGLRKMDEPKYVERRFNQIEPRSILRFGDILMNLVGASIGRTAYYDRQDEANINQAVALVRLINIELGLDAKFLLHYFNSPLAIDLMLASRVVTAQPNMSLTDAREFPVPVPPVAEQHRIVARVEELQAVCDQLEVQLCVAQTEGSRLLEAVLHQAIATKAA